MIVSSAAPPYTAAPITPLPEGSASRQVEPHHDAGWVKTSAFFGFLIDTISGPSLISDYIYSIPQDRAVCPLKFANFLSRIFADSAGRPDS